MYMVITFLNYPYFGSKNCHLNSTHSDYVTNFKYRWHVQHMQTLNCQGSDNNVFFNDSITDNMHSLAPIK